MNYNLLLSDLQGAYTSRNWTVVENIINCLIEFIATRPDESDDDIEDGESPLNVSEHEE